MPAGRTSNASNKQNNSKTDVEDNIAQFTKARFDDVALKMIWKFTEPLKAELHDLKVEVQQLEESQNLLGS